MQSLLKDIKKQKLDKLSNEDKILLFKDGDFNTLIKCHMLFFKSKANSYANFNEDLSNEYFSIMLEGAANALKLYDPSKSPFISSYICKSAINNLNASLKKGTMQKRDGETVEYKEYHSDVVYQTYDNDITKEKEVSNTLDKMLSTLNDSDREIMNLMRTGLNQVQVSRVLGCTHQNINSKVKKIMKNLQKYITELK